MQQVGRIKLLPSRATLRLDSISWLAAHVLILIIGLLLFFVPHMLREAGLRQSVMNSLPSAGAYKGLYTLITLSGLGLIIWGKSVAPFTMLWQPVYELRYISHLLMLPAPVLLVAGNVPTSNIRKQLRNPMLLGVVFWGLAHLWSNGDLASMLLFGGFTLWGLIKFISLGLTITPDSKPASLLWDIISIIGGLSMYAALSIYHGQLFGVGLSLV